MGAEKQPLPILSLALITGLLVAAAVVVTVRSRPGPARGPTALLPAAERKDLSLELPTLDKKTWSLQEHAGKVVLLNYFATWCPPCRREMPDLVKLGADEGAKGLAVAMVSLDKDADENHPRADVLTEFNATEKLPFPILLPPVDSPLLNNEFPIPQTFLVDRRGKIALHVVGQIDPGTFTPLVEQLLREKP